MEEGRDQQKQFWGNLAAQLVEWEQNEGCHYVGAWDVFNPQFVGLEA